MSTPDFPADAYVKALFGQHARHVAFNYIVQSAGHGRAAIIGNTIFGKQMSFGATATHTLVLCDAIVRPRLVLESDNWRGTGAAGLLTCDALTSIDEWVRTGRVVLDPTGMAKESKR